MKNLFKILPFLLFSLFAVCSILSCKDTTTPQNSTTEATKIEKKKNSNSSAIFILNTRASSEGVGSESWALFDNKENTIWMTSPGTGQDESIRINFSPTQENYVEKLSIRTQAGGKIARLLKVSVEVNGKYLGVFNSNTKIAIKQNLKSLTIRFALTDGVKGFEKEVNGSIREIQYSHPKKTIGITDILMFDKNDAAMTIRDVQNYNGTITTGATLKPSELHSPTHLFDGNEAFAWVEGTDGEGINETLKFDLFGEAPAEKMIFYNGYQRSQEHYEWNARVKKFSIKTENQTPQEFTLSDEMMPQVLTFDPPLLGKNYELKILEIYPGGKYKDLTISELAFVRPDNQVWRVKTNYQPKKVEIALKTDIGNLVDRYVSSASLGKKGMNTRTLILRSDGSFDLHSMEEIKEDIRDWRATGTWSGGSNGKVKLTGGLKVVGEDRTTSFSEQLTIKPSYVEGEKTFDKIYLN